MPVIPGRPGSVSPEQLKDILGEQDNSTFGNVLRFLGRPGFVIRNLLRADLEGAARNLGQMALDLPTGGFIDRNLSINNLINQASGLVGGEDLLPIDLTTKEDRPEFSDLVSRYPDRLNPWGKLALDVVGGALTDPLTYIGGVGVGRSIAPKALAGASRGTATSRVGQALLNSSVGKELLQESMEEVGEGVLKTFNARIAAADAAGDLATVNRLKAKPLYQQLLNSPLQVDDIRGPAQAGLRDLATERTFFKALANGDDLAAADIGRLNEAFTQTERFEEGITALEKLGALKQPGGLEWRIPFTGAHGAIPGTRNFWSKAGKYGTAPGWVKLRLDAADHPLGKLIDEGSTQLTDWVTTNFFNRAHHGALPVQLTEETTRAASNMWGTRREVDEVVRSFGGALTDQEWQGVGRVWDSVQDAWTKGEITSLKEGKRRLIDGAADYLSEVRGSTEIVTDLTDAQRLARSKGRLIVQQLDDGRYGIRDLDAFRGEVEPVMNKIMNDFQQIPKELVRAGWWKELKANPFYLPRQADDIFREITDGAFLDRGITRTAIGKRKYASADEFTNSLEETAKGLGIDTDGLRSQETHLLKLYRKRMYGHTRWKAMDQVAKKAKRLGRADDTFNQYLRAQFQPLGLRENILGKLLGGGEFAFKMNDTPGLREWFKTFNTDGWLFSGARYDKKAGEAVFSFNGMNAVWKPYLTVVRPNFHARNGFGAAFMASFFDPDLTSKTKAVKNTIGAFLDAPIVNMLKKEYGPDEIVDVLKVLGDDAAEAAKAAARLEARPGGVGRYSWKQAIKILKKHLGPQSAPIDLGRTGVAQVQQVGRAELARQVSEVADRGREIHWATRALANGAPKPLHKRLIGVISRGLKKLRDAGSNYATKMENRYRATALLEGLAKGIDEQQAVKRMGDMFVDYTANSTTERFIRDVVPFAKFSMASTKWIKTMANDPWMVNWMGRVRASGEDQVLTERTEDSLAFPLPWRDKDGNQEFLLSLGLPLEVTLNVLGIPRAVIPDPDSGQAFRRQILGGAQPLLKLPMQSITNRNFYFGGDFAEYRKAPNWLREVAPWATKQIKLPNGVTRYEINGTWNEIINTSPTSAVESMLDRLIDRKKTLWNKALTFTTGTRIESLDDQRELRKLLERWLRDKAASGEVGDAIIYFERFEPDQMPEDLKVVLGEWRRVKQERRKAKKRGY